YTTLFRSPAGDLWQVIAVAGNELLVVDKLVADRLLRIRGARSELRHAVDRIADEVEAIKIIQHAHVERRRRRPFLFVAAYVNVRVTFTPISQPMNEPRIAVKGEDNRLVRREERVEFVVGQTMRMLARRLQLHQIDNIDDADFQLGRVLSKEVDGSERLQGRHVAATGHHDIGFAALVIAGPLPDPEPLLR